MPEEYTNRELGIMIKDGFKGVHDRQDVTNGNVKDNCDNIKTNQDKIHQLSNWRWMITGGIGVIVALVIPLLFLIIKSYF